MSDLLHPPSLARTLKDAAARNASSAAVADPDADAAATRAALEACEKTAALLRTQLAPVDSDSTHDAPPHLPAKGRFAVSQRLFVRFGISRRGVHSQKLR